MLILQISNPNTTLMKQFQTKCPLTRFITNRKRLLESSQALIEALRSSQIEIYSYMKLTGELGNRFELRIKQIRNLLIIGFGLLFGK